MLAETQKKCKFALYYTYIFMKKLLYLLIVSLLASCMHQNKFKIEGIVEAGAGEMIYLEHAGLLKTTVLDSTEIDDDGSFKFRATKPEYPDFYRVRTTAGQITFAIDSTETISIKTNAVNFALDYSIEGSQNSKDIQLLRKSVGAIQKKANGFYKGMSQAENEKLLNEILLMIEEHKKMARPLILKNPRSTAAYFAIYQQVNNTYLFSPYDKEDKPYCAAVATSYNTFMPAYERSKNLYELVMDAIKKERQSRNNSSWKEIMNQASLGYIDISLPDKTGREISLSSLSGKTILLDFSAYESRESVQYTFALRELYNQYASRGFEIYQVSLDRNEMLWKESVHNIPWICVRDLDGPASRVASSYNINNIPTYFLISKAGDIIARNPDLNTLQRAIEQDIK
jgi:peroxiredoxin